MLDDELVPAAYVVHVGGKLRHVDDCVSCSGCGEWFLHLYELDDDHRCDDCAQEAADEREYYSTRISTFRDRES